MICKIYIKNIIKILRELNFSLPMDQTEIWCPTVYSISDYFLTTADGADFVLSLGRQKLGEYC